MFASLVACGAVHFAAATVLFGTAGFLRLLLAPSLRRVMADRSRVPLRWAALLLIGSGAAWPTLEAAQLGEGWADALDPGAIGAVLFDTGFGRAWSLHLVCVVALAGALIAGRGRPTIHVAVLAGLAVASLALVGHAASRTGPLGWALKIADTLHLLAGGAWLGSLPAFGMLLRRTDDALRQESMAALRRYSAFGHVAVALVLLTGLADTVLVLGRVPVGATPYQAVLLAKTGLVAAMTALAIRNRYGLVPRLRATPEALAHLKRNVGGSVVLGAAVLLATAVLGMLDPE